MNLIQTRAELALHYYKVRKALIAKYERLMDSQDVEQESVILMADRLSQLNGRAERVTEISNAFWDACEAALAASNGNQIRVGSQECERFLSQDILPIEEKWFQEDCLNMARLREGIEIKYKEYQEVSLQELMQDIRTAT